MQYRGGWGRRMLTGAALALALVWAPLAQAESLVETWRSPFGRASAVSINPDDSSHWVAAGASVTHYAADGTLLTQTNGLWGIISIAASPADAACWVLNQPSALTAGHSLLRIGPNGTRQWSREVFVSPVAVAADTPDGSCWVADLGANRIVHIAAGGQAVSQVSCDGPVSVSTDPVSGACWAAVGGDLATAPLPAAQSGVVRISGGAVTTRTGFSNPQALSVNRADGSCWVADTGVSQVVHLSPSGGELWRGTVDGALFLIQASPADGGCWIGDPYMMHLSHLGADGASLGNDLWRIIPGSLSVDPTDGSCWVADAYHGGSLQRVSTDGIETRVATGLAGWFSISANVLDGSCWVQAGGEFKPGGGDPATLTHFAADGTQLVQVDSGGPGEVAADPIGGGCWGAWTDAMATSQIGRRVLASGDTAWDSGWSGRYLPPAGANSADGTAWMFTEGGALAHLALDGTELWRGGSFVTPVALSVNAGDGSVWVADAGAGQVVHLASNGNELWRGGGFTSPASISASAVDGSLWIADRGVGALVHLAASGAELWRGSFPGISSVSADAPGGGCWVTDVNALLHVRADGTVRGRLAGFGGGEVSASPSDHAVWVVDENYSQVARVVALPEGNASRGMPKRRGQAAGAAAAGRAQPERQARAGGR